MCLELINQLINSTLALWGLVTISLVLAALATIAILTPSRRRHPHERQPASFTCPCYAPPYVPQNHDGE